MPLISYSCCMYLISRCSSDWCDDLKKGIIVLIKKGNIFISRKRDEKDKDMTRKTKATPRAFPSCCTWHSYLYHFSSNCNLYCLVLVALNLRQSCSLSPCVYFTFGAILLHLFSLTWLSSRIPLFSLYLLAASVAACRVFVDYDH